MKNGEAIWSAAKALGKELSIGFQEEYEELKEKAGKIKAEYKDGTLADSMKQKFEKDKADAETVIADQIEHLEKEVQKLRELLEQQKAAGGVTADAEDFADAEPAAEEAPVEEAPAEETPVEEAPVEEVPAQEPIQE